jgi:hypothetical protein
MLIGVCSNVSPDVVDECRFYKWRLTSDGVRY